MSSSFSSLRGYRRQATVPGLAIGAVAIGLLGATLTIGIPHAASFSRLGSALLALALLLAATATVLWYAEREAARVRRTLAAGLSHDLRTPLSQIRMFTEMLLMDLDRSPDERLEWLQSIERETHRLGDMLDNLLLFIHGDERDPFPVRQLTDLGALVEDVSAGFSERAAGSGMELLADPPSGITVSVDPQALRQVIVNLLDNALRFGPSGQTILVSVTTADEHAVVSVADEGPGIAPKDRGSAWKAFVRPRSAVDVNGGGGLGLAVVKRVVELHEGRVWIDDAEGGGARVSLSLPIRSSATSPDMRATHLVSGSARAER